LIREKSKLLPLIEEYRKLYNFSEVIPISALKRNGLDALLQDVIAALPAGPAYFPEDQVTDQPARFMAAEIIREQVLVNTSEEIPYATTVIVDNFEEGAKLTRVAATIYCERPGQKGILVGKGGLMLKKIGTSARIQIERMMGTKVFLELYVKAEPGWRDSRRFVEELDWRRQLEHRMRQDHAETTADNLDHDICDGVAPAQDVAQRLDERNSRIKVSTANRAKKCDQRREYRDRCAGVGEQRNCHIACRQSLGHHT